MNALVDGGAAPKLKAGFGASALGGGAPKLKAFAGAGAGAFSLAGAPKLNAFAAAGAGAAGKAKGFDAAGALGAATGALLSSFATWAR